MKETFKHRIERYWHNPWSMAKGMARRGWLNPLSDKAYLSIIYRASFGRRINWKNPKTYSEKLQWLKLYDRNAIYPKMVDKYEAKQWIAAKVGSEYVPEVLGGPWNSFEEIDFDKLPDQFVLKTTHDCGGVWICTDKSKLDVDKVKAFLKNHMETNYYWGHREWPYKNLQPRIFAEEHLDDFYTGELRDYKFFTFNGVPKMMFIASERQRLDTETKFDFFDMEYRHLSFVQGHPNSDKPIDKPVHFEKMKELASALAEGLPQLRVDFFECNGRLYVGELTFFHYAGFVPFEPEEWDERIGSWLRLPKKEVAK